MNRRIAQAALRVGRLGGVGGPQWTVKRPDTNDALQTVATLSPVYIVPEKPSNLERVLSQSAATVRTHWKLVASAGIVSALAAGDTLISTADTSLSFLVTGLDSASLPTVTLGTLEQKPYV